ncbi:MAG TPA: accessory Sec system translocase SecA2, partial [Nocardioides sp.]|nr:accessory Sec system translocase SecA2 [Nocardioides sp.]
EGVQLEIHRNTWRYTRLIEHQRKVLLEYRDDLLRTDLAATELAAVAGERWSTLTESHSDEELERAARQILLYHLDDRWTEHLAFLADVRESIHLRALAKETPIDEFHRTAIPEFRKISDEIAERAAKTLEKVEITAEGANLEAQGLRRPSATWTYMVHDNPFDTDAEQALQRVRTMIKKVRGGARR